MRNDSFLLFAGYYYYPSGGINDIIGQFDTCSLAIDKFENDNIDFEWAHIYSVYLRRNVMEYDNGKWNNNLVKATYLFPNDIIATFGYDDQQLGYLQGEYSEELVAKIKESSTSQTEWRGYHRK